MESTQKFYGDQNKNSEMTDHDNLLHETCYFIIIKTLTLECHSEEVLNPTLDGGGHIVPPPSILCSGALNIGLRGPRFRYNSYFIVTM